MVAMPWDDTTSTEEVRAPREAFDVETIGGYRLIQRLGEGGMGVVHLALDRSGRAVAIKVLRPHVAADTDARVRLAREVELLQRIRSPHVAPVVDADVQAERPYLVTRYIPGRTLDEIVSEGGPLPPAELHQLAAGLAKALEAIHGAGVVHRDLKPTNVLMLSGEPVLIDFGIAHLAGDMRLTATGLVMGTPGYLAPELIDGEEVTPQTDWWGWAATVAYAASGGPPFGRGPMDAVLARVMRGEPNLEAVDPRLAPLLSAALSPSAAQRPDPQILITALDRYARGELLPPVVGAGPVAPVATLAPETTVMEAPLARTRVIPAQPRTAPVPPNLPAPVHPAPASPQVRAIPSVEGPALAPDDLPVAPAADPRIGKPDRSGTLAALLVLLGAIAASAPVVALMVLAVVMVIARTVDRAITARVIRRYSRGPGSPRGELAWAVAASPWHALLGVGASALAMLLPVIVGVSAVLAAAAVVIASSWSVEGRAMVALACGGVAAGLTAWWGPAGISFRRGSRSLVRGLSHGSQSSVVLVVVTLVAAAGVVVWGWSTEGTVWAPLSGIPALFETTLGS